MFLKNKKLKPGILESLDFSWDRPSWQDTHGAHHPVDQDTHGAHHPLDQDTHGVLYSRWGRIVPVVI